MADGFEQGSGRDARGRFVPGQSGNPLGKVPGTRNRATLLRAALDGPEGPAIARIIIDKALAGDVVTAKFCLARLEPAPRPRSEPIEIDLPDGTRARDIVAAYDATVRAMAAGEITPEEALEVTRVLDGRRKAIEAAWQEEEREARAERRATAKPSPLGGGLGEGAATRSNVAARVAARRPHPDPLPRGEGDAMAGEGVGFRFDAAGRVAAERPHPDPLPEGEGAMRDEAAGPGQDFLRPPRLRRAARFPGDLLHSTCISRVPPLSPALAQGGWVV
jgi:hypothetical protein